MLRDRFRIVQQRLRRPNVLQAAHRIDEPRYIELSTIDTLLGSQGGVKWLLGMLCEVEEGSFYLEDMNAHVPLDLSGAVTTPGMFTENCIVLTEGEMVDGQFRVKIMGFPPPQQRTESLEAIGTFDLFRTGITPQNWAKMQELEEQANDDMFVIVSDVHLDRPQVLEKLREMFEGFSGMPQLPLFVLIGDFTSRPVSFGKDGVQQLLGHFRNLANLIAEFPLLAEEGRFVFVPGPRDPGAGNTLPARRSPRSSRATSRRRCRTRASRRTLAGCASTPRRSQSSARTSSRRCSATASSRRKAMSERWTSLSMYVRARLQACVQPPSHPFGARPTILTQVLLFSPRRRDSLAFFLHYISS